MKQKIFDETSGNPLPERIVIADSLFMGFSPVASGGFYHDADAIKSTAATLAGIIGLKPSQRTIDIGYGHNLSVAKAMLDAGMDAYGLDSQDGLDTQRFEGPLFVPPYFNSDQNGVKTYCGTIEDILHPDSELKDQDFDLFTFWGSWDAGGNNFAIGGEMGWFRAVKQLEEKYGHEINPYNNPEVLEKMAQNKRKILEDSRRLLNPDGGILIVSSRYSGHGGGFASNQLPFEKIINLRLANIFSQMGASEICLFGISKDSVRSQLGSHPEYKGTAAALCDDDILFSKEEGGYDLPPTKEEIAQIKAMDIPLGRIDAVYARFS
ncbi:hypothetical protein JW707_02725 [Candidatus Woesearchaeota archaeon]|nr:hypothetical protein [Candidatus Woesearchaeota archaeon]